MAPASFQNRVRSVGIRISSLPAQRLEVQPNARNLGRPAITALCEVAQAPAYRAELERIPGCHACGVGGVRFDAGGSGAPI